MTGAVPSLALATLTLAGCSLGFEDDLSSGGGGAAGGGAKGGAAGAPGGRGGSAGGAGSNAAGTAGSGGRAGGAGQSGAGNGGRAGGAGAENGGSGGASGGGQNHGGSGAAGASGNAGSSIGGAAGLGGMSAGQGGKSGAGGAGIACTEATDGAQRCTGPLVETCSQGKWVPLLDPCAKGCVQQGVFASCRICAPGAAECSGTTYEVCRADGTGFDASKRVVCGGETPVCNAALGGCRACAPGEKRCIGAAAAVCSAAGSFDLASATLCGSTAQCVNGACAAPVCTAGSILCANDLQSYTTCKADGSGFGEAISCDKVGVCTPGLGCTSTCTTGSFRCQGDILQQCAKGDFLTVTTCAEGRCDALAGECDICHPGEFTCADHLLRQCNPAGSGYLDTPCSSAASCDASRGRCVECTTGQTKCDGYVFSSCDGQGSFQQIDDCEGKGECTAAGCALSTCKAGDLRCAANHTREVCNASGTGYSAVSPSCPVACLDGEGCGVVTSLVASAAQTCAIVGDSRRLLCWGQSFLTGADQSPTLLPGIIGVTKLALADDYACYLVSGEVYCVGQNGFGQLGNGSVSPSTAPVKVTLPGAASDVSAKNGATCAVVDKDGLYCWGRRPLGLGPGDLSPTSVSLVGAPTSVTVGSEHRCVTVGTFNNVYCAGVNAFGALGSTGSDSAAFVGPVPLAASAGLLQAMPGTVVVGGKAGAGFSCGVSGGSTACWGTNNLSQIAQFPADGSVHPKAEFFGSGVRITVGEDHGCLLDGGTVRCWGERAQGQTSTVVPQAGSTPSVSLETVSLPPATLLAAGARHTCAFVSPHVYCWGRNDHGQLGRTGSDTQVPQIVPLPLRWLAHEACADSRSYLSHRRGGRQAPRRKGRSRPSRGQKPREARRVGLVPGEPEREPFPG